MRSSLGFSIVAALAVADGAGAAEKVAFTIPDLYRLQGVEEPALAPDGKTIVYKVTTSDLGAVKRQANLWRIDPDGANGRALTFTDKTDSVPRFSPDGKTLYFLSTRSGETQVWSMSGGEPQKRTAFPGGVGAFTLSGDGRLLAVSADVWVECGADAACNKKKDDARGQSKLKAHLADHLLYRHWTEWRDAKRSHVLVLDLTRPEATLRDLTPGDFDSPLFQVGGPPGFALSPDGRELAFTSNREGDEASTTNADLFTAAVAAPAADLEKPRNLTAANRAWDGSPAYSPDGRFLAYRMQKVPGWESDRFRIAVVDRRTGAVVCRRRVGEPQELFRIDLREKPLPPQRLTTHNAAVEAEVDVRPAEEIAVPGAGGRPVQVFIVKPHGFDPARRYPVILNIHGGPQTQWADSFRGDWQVYPGAGYVVAFPNPHGSTGFGEEYTGSISGDWEGKVMEDIARVTDAVAALPYVDPDRMGVMGWSWGGYAVMWLEGHAHPFKAMASMMGVYDLRSMFSSTEELWFPLWELKGAPWENPAYYQKASPSRYVTAFKTPCLVITGEKDFRVPYTQSLMFFTDLQKRGVPSRLLVFEEAGHWPAWHEMALYYAAHLDWFHRYLGGGASPWDPRGLARGAGFGDAP